MTINTSSFGGGQFISKFASNAIVITSGATGTLVTITPPAGQRVKLTSLASAGATLTSLTTVNVNAVAIISDCLLVNPTTDPTTTGQLKIGFGANNQDPITGNADEAITLTTNVATSANIVYTYQFGV